MPLDTTANGAARPAPTPGLEAQPNEDYAILQGIRTGIKDGLERALSEALGIRPGHDLVGEEEVDDIEECIGDKMSVIVNCIKSEHLPAHSGGDQASEEQHTEAIQQCILPEVMEHVEYCVGKLEIQHLGHDAQILQELYEVADLKKGEYDMDHPDQDQDEGNEYSKVASPLFDQSWYEEHKPASHDDDLLKGPGDKAKVLNPVAVGGAGMKPTNSTLTGGAKLNTTSPLPTPGAVDAKKDDSQKADGKDVPFSKRKFGYGPDWRTAPGRRDPHPLPRRDLDESGAWQRLDSMHSGDGKD